LTDDDAKVFNFLDMEVALLWLEVEVMFFKFLQNLVYAAHMLFLVVFGHDDNVVHVDFNPTLGNLFLEDVIHHCLERGRWVHQSKEYHGWFEEAFTGLEGGFLFISWFDGNIVIFPSNIEFCEQHLSSDAVNEVRDKRKGVLVWHCPLVQVVVILNWSKLAIFLLYKEETAGIWRLGLANPFQIQILFNEGVLGLLFLWWQGIDSAIYWGRCIFLQVDYVVPFLWSGEAFRGFLLENVTITMVAFWDNLIPCPFLLLRSLFSG
jgi:hypothetical protein